MTHIFNVPGLTRTEAMASPHQGMLCNILKTVPDFDGAGTPVHVIKLEDGYEMEAWPDELALFDA